MSKLGGFVRYQATEQNNRGNFPGVFGLANALASDGKLTPADRAWWRSANDWFNAAYPDPCIVDPSVYDRTKHPGAQAWFKDSAEHLLERVSGYVALLHRYGVDCEEVWSDGPGRILYEDEFQIVVVPTPRPARHA